MGGNPVTRSRWARATRPRRRALFLAMWRTDNLFYPYQTPELT